MEHNSRTTKSIETEKNAGPFIPYIKFQDPISNCSWPYTKNEQTNDQTTTKQYALTLLRSWEHN